MSWVYRDITGERFGTWNGKTQCIADWADEFGVPRDRFYDRIKRGVPLNKVLAP